MHINEKRFWKLWYSSLNEHEILYIRGLLLFYLWNLMRFDLYVGSTWFIYSSYIMLCFFMIQGLYTAFRTSYIFSTWFIYSSYMYYWNQTHELLFHHGFVRRGAENVVQPHRITCQRQWHGASLLIQHHLFCSAMAEPGAQGARRGATVQGNAWRMAGTSPSSPQPSSAHCRRSAERSLPLVDTTTTWMCMPSQGASTHRFGVIGGKAESA
jgi:hypothetical protein